MGVTLKVGEQFEMKGRTLTVSATQVDVLPRVRDVLIDVARKGATIPYGTLKSSAGLTHAPNGMGRLLDVLSEDCFRRDEPSLAAIVVDAATQEVGSDFEGDAGSERAKVYEFWRP